MMTSSRTALVTLAMIFLGGGAAVSACADESPRWTVRFADLDVNTSVGIHALYNRIDFAAAQVCERENTHALGHMLAFYKCKEAATSHAVAEARIPALTSYYSQHSRPSMLLARR